MSFLSILKKIALPAIGIAATPFTGGASLLGTLGASAGTASAIGAGAGALGTILGGASQNQQNERILTNTDNLKRDQLALDRYKVNEGLPGSRLQTSVRASQVANAQPVTFNYPGAGGTFNPQDAVNGKFMTISGGYNTPGLIGDKTKQQANAVVDQMFQKQMSGDVAPAITGPVKEGVGSKILGGVGLGSSILGALGTIKMPGHPALTTPPMPMTNDPYYDDPAHQGG